MAKMVAMAEMENIEATYVSGMQSRPPTVIELGWLPWRAPLVSMPEQASRWMALAGLTTWRRNKA